MDALGRVVTDETIAPEEARKQEWGSVIHRWLDATNKFHERFPGREYEFEFNRTHFDTAEKFAELHRQYMASFGGNGRSASDYDGPGGYDGSDPFSEANAKRRAHIETEFRRARERILESCPLGMMAVEAIVLENRAIEELRGDLRMALNALSVLWRLQSAA